MRIFSLSLLALMLSACGGGSGGSSTSSPAPTPAPNPSITSSPTPNPPVVPTPPSNPTTDIKGTLNMAVDISDYKTTPSLSTFAITSEHRKVVELTNRLRAEKGLAPLVIDENLSRYATIRTQEVVDTRSHRRPDGSQANQFGNLSHRSGGLLVTGENIAWGTQTDAAKAVEQWRNSTQGHYENMMNPNVTKIGVGHHYDPNSYYKNQWVQIFGSNPMYSYEAESALTATPVAVRQRVQNAVQKNANGGIIINAPTARIPEGSASRGGIHGTVHVVDLGNHQRIILRAPQSASWQFQTIGELQHYGHPLAYVNVGEKFIPADDAVIKARYVGQSVGDVGKRSRVIADVVADVDFSRSGKTMDLRLSNSQMAENDLAAIGQKGLQAAPSLDFSERLAWDSVYKRFENGHGHASFYGAGAREIGGQFARNAKIGADREGKPVYETYRGAYGAVKQ